MTVADCWLCCLLTLFLLLLLLLLLIGTCVDVSEWLLYAAEMLQVNDSLILIQWLLTVIIQTQLNSHTHHTDCIESHPCTPINLQYMQCIQCTPTVISIVYTDVHNEHWQCSSTVMLIVYTDSVHQTFTMYISGAQAFSAEGHTTWCQSHAGQTAMCSWALHQQIIFLSRQNAADRYKTRCVAMPSLMAARWVGQNSGPFFLHLPN